MFGGSLSDAESEKEYFWSTDLEDTDDEAKGPPFLSIEYFPSKAPKKKSKKAKTKKNKKKNF